ncbi:MAG: phosphodiesterase [Lachnospiraceae bacterium]|nr:phosphodiesterase [Lachnospiraceae bacterium]
MKWFVASDIHGSSYYCKRLLEAFEREKADRILLLGDLLYHGPRNELPKEYDPKSVYDMLNAYKESIVAVRGNCDCEVDQMVLEFPILADYAVISVGEKTIYATHGHVYNNENPLPFLKGAYLLAGHTHVPRNVKVGDYTYLNPGSVSIPKENSHHGYIIITESEITFKDLDGTVMNIN